MLRKFKVEFKTTCVRDSNAILSNCHSREVPMNSVLQYESICNEYGLTIKPYPYPTKLANVPMPPWFCKQVYASITSWLHEHEVTALGMTDGTYKGLKQHLDTLVYSLIDNGVAVSTLVYTDWLFRNQLAEVMVNYVLYKHPGVDKVRDCHVRDSLDEAYQRLLDINRGRQ